MNPFAYVRASDLRDAARLLDEHPRALCIAGGTTVVDLMKERVLQPDLLIDISRAPEKAIDVRDDRIEIGALARMSDVADHPQVASAFPVVTQALLASASGQLRNMATFGGNLLQRTRCVYFRDVATPCNKRNRGEGCAAIGGWNRQHAVLGTSEHCIATHASDLAVALVACDAQVQIAGANGTRSVPLEHFYRMPGATPDVENDLAHGEVIASVMLSRQPLYVHSAYLKIRDRASFEFALVSVAVALEVPDGRIEQARVALGGVATKPWRASDAERVLVGQVPSRVAFEAAGNAAVSGARGYGHNDFKMDLARRAVVRALCALEPAG
jgi:xanthine dehydrogenase YagS FAD-binding subunit